MSCAQVPTQTVFSTPVVTSIATGNVTQFRTAAGFTETVTSYTSTCVPIIIGRRDHHHKIAKRQSADCVGGWWSTYQVTSTTYVPPVTYTQVFPTLVVCAFHILDFIDYDFDNVVHNHFNFYLELYLVFHLKLYLVFYLKLYLVFYLELYLVLYLELYFFIHLELYFVFHLKLYQHFFHHLLGPLDDQYLNHFVLDHFLPDISHPVDYILVDFDAHLELHQQHSFIINHSPFAHFDCVHAQLHRADDLAEVPSSSPASTIVQFTSSASSSASVAPFIISPSNTETASSATIIVLDHHLTLSSEAKSASIPASTPLFLPSSSIPVTPVVLPVSPTTTTGVFPPDSTATGISSSSENPGGDKTTHKHDVGGIVGGTLGGLFFLAFLGFFALKYIKDLSNKNGPKDKAKVPGHGGDAEAGESLVNNLYHPGMFSGGAAGYGSTSNGGPGGKGGKGNTGNSAPPDGSGGPQMTQVHHNAAPTSHGPSNTHPTHPSSSNLAQPHGHGYGHHGAHGNPHSHTTPGHGAGGHGAGGGGPNAHAPPSNGLGGPNGSVGHPGGGPGHVGHGGNPGGGYGGNTGLEGGNGGGGAGAGGAGANGPTAPPGTGGELGGSSGAGGAGGTGGAGGGGTAGTESSAGFTPQTQAPGTTLPGSTATPGVTGVGTGYGPTGHESKVGHIIPVVVPMGARRRRDDNNNAQAKAAMVNTLPSPYYLPPSNPTSPALTPTIHTRLLDDGFDDGSASNYASSQEHLSLPAASRVGGATSSSLTYSVDGDPFAGEPEGTLPTYQAGPSTGAYYGRNEKRR